MLEKDAFRLVPSEIAALVVQAAALILGVWCVAVVVLGLGACSPIPEESGVLTTTQLSHPLLAQDSICVSQGTYGNMSALRCARGARK